MSFTEVTIRAITAQELCNECVGHVVRNGYAPIDESQLEERLAYDAHHPHRDELDGGSELTGVDHRETSGPIEVGESNDGDDDGEDDGARNVRSTLVDVDLENMVLRFGLNHLGAR